MKKLITLFLTLIAAVSNAQLYNVENTNGTYSASGAGLTSYVGTNATTIKL